MKNAAIINMLQESSFGMRKELPCTGFKNMSAGNTYLLGFSKCLRAGFYTFSRLKFKVNKGTNSCNLCFKIKTKTYLVFISMVTIHSACY